MKKKLYILSILCLSLLSFAACDRESLDYGTQKPEVDNRPEGKVSVAGLQVGVTTEPVVKSTKIDLTPFIIRIFDKDHGNKLVNEWAYGDMPEIFTLKVGNYSIAAYSHDQLPAEFERPFYYGVRDFTVKENELTSIETLKCILRSIMVTVVFDDELKQLLSPDVKTTVQLGEGQLIYQKDESRAGHFYALNDNQNLLQSTLIGTIDGEPVNLSKAFPDVKAGEHRIIKYTIKNVGEEKPDEGSGSITINIDMSCTVVDKDEVIKPGEDVIPDEKPDPDPTPDPDPNPVEDMPVIVGQGFDITQPVNIPESGEMNVVVNISAPKGIANLFVDIDSETLTEDILVSVGLAKTFDLAHPGALQEGLSGLGFPTGDQVIGKKELVFDISQFIPLLGIYGAGTHNFKISVVDQAASPNTKRQTLTLISH